MAAFHTSGYIQYDEDKQRYNAWVWNNNDEFHDRLETGMQQIVFEHPKRKRRGGSYYIGYARKAPVEAFKKLYEHFVTEFKTCDYEELPKQFCEGWLRSVVNLKGRADKFYKNVQILIKNKGKMSEKVRDFTVYCIQQQKYKRGYYDKNGNFIGHHAKNLEKHYEPKVRENYNDNGDLVSWRILLTRQLEVRNFARFFHIDKYKDICESVTPHPCTYERSTKEMVDVNNYIEGGGKMFRKEKKGEDEVGPTGSEKNLGDIPTEVQKFADSLGNTVEDAQYNEKLEKVVWYLDDDSVITMEENEEGEVEPVNYPGIKDAEAFSEKFADMDYQW